MNGLVQYVCVRNNGIRFYIQILIIKNLQMLSTWWGRPTGRLDTEDSVTITMERTMATPGKMRLIKFMDIGFMHIKLFFSKISF